jgi:hypothetical protein
MPAVSPILFEFAQVVDQLVIDLILRAHKLLQMEDFVDEYLVSTDDLTIRLLETLDLVLRRSKLFRKGSDLLAGSGSIILLIYSLGFPWGRRLSSNVVQVILSIRSEFGVLEFPCLICMSSVSSSCKTP